MAAGRRAEEILGAAATADEGHLADVLARRFDAVARVLSTLCGSAPFFVPTLVRHPDWLFALADEDFATPRRRTEYEAALTSQLAGTSAADHVLALRQFKYYELARITVRELSTDLVPVDRVAETLTELSHLADALLSAALTLAASRIRKQYGSPRWIDTSGPACTGRFAVLGMGKLGAEELNYSSDVDLIYVFESPDRRTADADTDLQRGGPSGLSPAEYFTRLAQEFGRVVTEPTAEGFLYRIDLDLRPEGTKGPLVVSGDTLMEYHECWAATWEKAAYMKARPIAGDIALGWRVIRSLGPMIYRSAMDYDTVTAIKELKDKVERSAARGLDTFHLKVGTGGIRDIESVAQALQLLHGGRIPEVRVRGTQAALDALAQVGVLPRVEADALLAAYRVLRRAENLVQMVAERQTHHLPKSPEDLACLARSMGLTDDDPVAAFQSLIQNHRDHVRRIVAELFDEGGRARILGLFARRVPRLLEAPMSRAIIEELADRFAREIDAAPHPQRAMNNLDRFVEGVGSRGFYYQLLHDRPELVHRLTALFAASEYLSSYFANHPRLIEPIFRDPNVLLLTREELERNFAAVRRDATQNTEQDDAEVDLEALRLAYHREVLNVGLLDLDNKISRAQVEAALSDIAEVCLARALVVAREQTQRYTEQLPPAASAIEFLVVGMGKLASRELAYGSDLDVIFLYDGADEDTLLAAQDYFVRLAQKSIWALRTRTAAGFCYDIDTRLRPSGNQGMLVTSLRAFERYHDSSAQVWEHQALLRARPVAGSQRLGSAFETLRRRILGKPLPTNLGEEVHRVRLRMEAELAQETAQRHDFKTGRGGMQDIETVVQYLQLQHGAARPELFDLVPVATHLERLERLGFLDAPDARVLIDGWEFLQRLSGRLRIVENRSMSDLDEERGDLDALARGLGYAAHQRASSASRALLDHYRHHTSKIRTVYAKTLALGKSL